MHVCVADIADVDSTGCALNGYVATQFLGMQRAGRGTKHEAGIGRDLHLVIYPAASLVCARQQMRENIDSIASLSLINFDFRGMGYCGDYDLFGDARVH